MDDKLTQLGLIDEEEIILDEAALSLAALDHPDTDLASYLEFLGGIATRVGAVARRHVIAPMRFRQCLTANSAFQETVRPTMTLPTRI